MWGDSYHHNEGYVLDTRVIETSKGHIILVDKDDYERLRHYKWQSIVRPGKRVIYARRMARVNGKRTQIPMHAEIIGKKDGMVVDHINGNGLDNRRSNLRHATKSQNAQNCRRRNKAGYLGVIYRRKDNAFHARIKAESRRVHIGVYKTAEEAAMAYDLAAVLFYGPRAKVNLLCK